MKSKPKQKLPTFESKPIHELKPVYDPFRTGIIAISLIVIILTYIVTVILISVLKAKGYYDGIKELIASKNGFVYVGFGLGAMGYLLYFLKQRQQFWYGVFELGWGGPIWPDTSLLRV